MLKRFLWLLTCCPLFTLAAAAPIPPNPPDPSQLGGRAVPGLSNVFKKKIAVMVLVRDDVKLHTDVCVLRVGKEHMLINPRDVTRTDSAGWGA